MNEPITIGVIVSTRGFFPAWLAEQGRTQILDRLRSLGIEAVILPDDATAHGAVETLDDARKCAALFRKRADDIRGILVVLPNFGDELGVVEAIDRAALNVPVMVLACDDALDKLDLRHRRDAFCGKLSVCCNLHQRGLPNTLTTLHTCEIDGDAAAQDILFFRDVCRVVAGLRGARLGAIGQRPNPFNTVRFSEKLLQASGISVQVVDLSEILAAATALGDAPEVTERVQAIREYGRVAESADEQKLRKAACLALAMERWTEENQVVATAVQCWSSVQQNYGTAACLAMSMMGESGRPSACETDVMGALSMYALQLASGEPSGYLDWNNNLGNDRERCICLHCSNFPRGFLGQEPEIGTLDILGASLGEDLCFGAVKGRVQPGPMTFAKISTDDLRGRVRAYVGEGEFTDDVVKTPGGVATCQVPGLQDLLRHLCREGFEHHVAMSRSHCADVLAEAFGNYLGWDCHRHEA